jgi:DNA polymerase-3 subunit gamma/tau
MLSKNAFNALLKTLEEPPENVIFIFATTEPHKVIATIISRCQRFDFKRIPIDLIVKNLRSICEHENLQYEEEALFQIAKKADGGMRDALSLMDQVISTGKDVIGEAIVREVFGILPFEVYERILLSIDSGNTGEVIRNLHSIIEMGNDIIEIVNGFLDYLRLCLLSFYDVETGEVSKAQYQALKNVCAKFDGQDLLYIISLMMKTKVDMKSGDNPAILLEIVLIKLSKIKDLVDIESVNNPIQPIIINQEVVSTIPERTSPPVNNTNLEKKDKVVAAPIQETKISETKTDAPVAKKANALPKQDNPVKKRSLRERLEEELNAKPTVTKKTETLPEQANKIPALKETVANLNIDFVNRHWDNLIKLIAKEDSILASMLNYVTIIDVTNRYIRATTDKVMTADILDKNKETLNIYFSDFFQKSINFDIEFTGIPAQESKELTMEAIEKEEPELAKLIIDTKSKIINRISTNKDLK